MIHQLHLKKSWFVFAILLLAAGTVVGAIYAAGASEQTDQTLKEYLNGFFQALPEQNNQGSAFKTALRENVRLFLLIFLGELSGVTAFIPTRTNLSSNISHLRIFENFVFSHTGVYSLIYGLSNNVT